MNGYARRMRLKPDRIWNLLYQLLESNWNRDDLSVHPEHLSLTHQATDIEGLLGGCRCRRGPNLILYSFLRGNTLLEGVLYLPHLRDQIRKLDQLVGGTAAGENEVEIGRLVLD